MIFSQQEVLDRALGGMVPRFNYICPRSRTLTGCEKRQMLGLGSRNKIPTFSRLVPVVVPNWNLSFFGGSA